MLRSAASGRVRLRARLWLEAALLWTGALAGAYCIANAVSVQAARRSAVTFQTDAARPSSAKVSVGSSDVIGSIVIPQLALAAPITNDIDRIELIRGVGHIPGTAFAGGLGTMGLAGHRDTFFRSLKNIKPGMQILVASSAGQYQYDVESVQIVDPSDVDVLSIQSKPKLVLVTCYPFLFIGAAPRRFIVTANLHSLLASAH